MTTTTDLREARRLLAQARDLLSGAPDLADEREALGRIRARVTVAMQRREPGLRSPFAAPFGAVSVDG